MGFLNRICHLSLHPFPKSVYYKMNRNYINSKKYIQRKIILPPTQDRYYQYHQNIIQSSIHCSRICTCSIYLCVCSVFLHISFFPQNENIIHTLLFNWLCVHSSFFWILHFPSNGTLSSASLFSIVEGYSIL